MHWSHNWPQAIKQSYSLGMLLTVVWKGEKKIDQEQVIVEWQKHLGVLGKSRKMAVVRKHWCGTRLQKKCALAF